MNYDVGIIGGAGPIAGRLFFDRIIYWYQENLGAWQDQDFPSIILISYPFSDMLTAAHDKGTVKKELRLIMESLQAKNIVIACNTLHSYIDDSVRSDSLVHLMKTTADFLSFEKPNIKPFVLCTTTSAEFKLHERYFECGYPSIEHQIEIDNLIEKVLKGKHDKGAAATLEQIILSEAKTEQKVVLGCTELSLLLHEYPILQDRILDPCDLAVKKICSLLNEK